ncbi:cob(I)yrinic acid a,c-diamide adenosyltransferase [Pseudalkalibacillus berkeleyi]|uniref:Corrinoid adenosyltransferase n=1 Tax=Pseudalkalibacillus berkeleyi TaxID=1069813 RepID=A0ABS9H067_9BACL|nr:cob(I)yrinic acid a,c-diamide adenosyltransferase [Pseudalkalibacillus berkeleyi]MCF6137476.1 cob(I)yrinic acid a,c-diamide adenosyltransferase [Pseudalkalibacillus berkeleyi]
MKIYTRTGDKGQTSLIGGRVEKDDLRVEAYGTIDEVNCFVGQIIAELEHSIFKDVLIDLEKIQHELFDCGGDLSNIKKNKQNKLSLEAVKYLEEKIDQYVDEAPELERFILPGGSKSAASTHIARTITRRAERLVVKLRREEPGISEEVLSYLNRLSDYFFALGRVINFRLKVKDVEYIRSAKVFGNKKGDQSSE